MKNKCNHAILRTRCPTSNTFGSLQQRSSCNEIISFVV